VGLGELASAAPPLETAINLPGPWDEAAARLLYQASFFLYARALQRPSAGGREAPASSSRR